MYSHVFSRVTEYERKNKMGLSNLVRLFAPTLMTVDGDPVSPDTNIGHLVICTYTPYLCRVNLVCFAWCFLQVSFESTQYEYSCVHAMISHYKWLFQVDEEEAKKEEVWSCLPILSLA